jgi:lipopolysaccharide/colanic/teichoic acid biosynthesis glycosyltransferase
MKNKEYLDVDSVGEGDLFSSSNNTSSRYHVNFGEIFYDTGFLKQLRFEMLRAQRSNSALSLILLALDKEIAETSIAMNEVLNLVRVNTRDIDIIGFLNENTIAILLPYTNEEGAKATYGKLVSVNKNTHFSTTIVTYPDQIFESLVKNGCVQADSFFFDLYDSMDGASWFQSKLKIGIDIVGSVICILALMPVMLITALVIKVTSPGPVIFKQLRLGKHGIPFTFYKFRSMYVNMDDQIHREYTQNLISGQQKEINHGSEENPLYKIKSDPRITRIGKFIRKTSIDELPQFFNVLKGEMSLVGPRPALSYEVEKYKPWHLRRILEVKPGITGLWQVQGRSVVGWDDSVRLDIQYIKERSLIFDLKILLRTVKVVLSCKGAE